jgi:hypothetical protein
LLVWPGAPRMARSVIAAPPPKGGDRRGVGRTSRAPELARVPCPAAGSAPCRGRSGAGDSAHGGRGHPAPHPPCAAPPQGAGRGQRRPHGLGLADQIRVDRLDASFTDMITFEHPHQGTRWQDPDPSRPARLHPDRHSRHRRRQHHGPVGRDPPSHRCLTSELRIDLSDATWDRGRHGRVKRCILAACPGIHEDRYGWNNSPPERRPHRRRSDRQRTFLPLGTTQ